MTKAKKPPLSANESWGVEEELEKLGRELDEKFEKEKLQLDKTSANAESRLEELALNTLKKAKSEWNNYEEQLRAEDAADDDTLDKLKVFLSASGQEAPFLSELSVWAFKKVIKPEKL